MSSFRRLTNPANMLKRDIRFVQYRMAHRKISSFGHYWLFYRFLRVNKFPPAHIIQIYHMTLVWNRSWSPNFFWSTKFRYGIGSTFYCEWLSPNLRLMNLYWIEPYLLLCLRFLLRWRGKNLLYQILYGALSSWINWCKLRIHIYEIYIYIYIYIYRERERERERKRELHKYA